MDPATLALISAGVSAAGSAAGGIFSKKKETKTEKRRRELIDDLLASVKGNGPYSDMFNTSEEAFNKSYVEPAKARFRNQIAPQIQQSYVYNGQQRGTGLDDTLTRAGVDLDQMLNEQYLNYQQQGQNRKQSAINSILNTDTGNGNQSTGEAARQGFAGYASSEGFGNNIGDIIKEFSNRKPNQPNYNNKPRSGYANDDATTTQPSYWDKIKTNVRG